MKSLNRIALAALLAGPLSMPSTIVRAETDAAGFERIAADQVAWKDIPNGRGVQAAVISGDPGKPGIYVIRAKFPPGIMSSPHTHDEDRYAVVLKGTWYTGTDADWDPAKTVPLKVGSFMKHPAKAIHFDGAKDEEVIVQIVGYGPSRTNVLSPGEGDFGNPHRLK